MSDFIEMVEAMETTPSELEAEEREAGESEPSDGESLSSSEEEEDDEEEDEEEDSYEPSCDVESKRRNRDEPNSPPPTPIKRSRRQPNSGRHAYTRTHDRVRQLMDATPRLEAKYQHHLCQLYKLMEQEGVRADMAAMEPHLSELRHTMDAFDAHQQAILKRLLGMDEDDEDVGDFDSE